MHINFLWMGGGCFAKDKTVEFLRCYYKMHSFINASRIFTWFLSQALTIIYDLDFHIGLRTF